VDKSNNKQSSKRLLRMKHTTRRVQAERSENRIRPAKHVCHQARQAPTPRRDNPNMQAVVTSPGWREMSLSARVIAMTLLTLARMDEKNSVTIDRKGLSYLTGITDPATLAKANREVQAIGLFEIKRGFRTKHAERPTVYRLTWWSLAFQRWLKAGYAVRETTTPITPRHHGTSTSGGFPLPTAAAEGPPPEAQNDLQNAPASAKANDLQQIGQAV